LLMFALHDDTLSAVTQVLVDGGYTGAVRAPGMADSGRHGASGEGNELHKFVVIPKRWVVERSFAWLEKCRRLWKNCERKLNTSLQFVVLAFIALLLRRH
jgi:transposase